MPSIAQLTDYDPMGNVTGFTPVETPVEQPVRGSVLNNVLNKLFRDDDKRYQLWPEKVVREGLTAAGDVYANGALPPGLRREDFTDIPVPNAPTKDSTTLGKLMNIAPVAWQPNDKIVEQAQAMSALAGTGGLAGTTDATLGATPFLRPALKYKEKLYKGKDGQQHMDVIPEALYPEFQRMAMSGEDISHYNFGFYNDKGQFLSREKALQYGIDTGLIDPQAGKFGALTSTLLADSSKPGVAIEATAKAGKNIDWDLIKTAENSLSGDAAKAIDRWVGGDKDFAKNGGLFGAWSPKPLKDALKNPETASQIEAVMKPIKDKLREDYGDSITLYRSHGKLPEGAKPDRELLSFTSDKNFADYHSGGGAIKEKKLFTEDEMKLKDKEYNETGKAQIDNNTWIEKYTSKDYEGNDFSYPAIMRKDGMVTDTDSPSAYMRDLNDWAKESNSARNSKLKNVYEAKIPIDDIVFITDRFGQKEFIVKNKDKKLFSSPIPVYENNEHYKFTPVDHIPEFK